MEFERALFRVYERSVSSLSFQRAGDSRITCTDCTRAARSVAMIMCLLSLTLLLLFHVAFVGRSECLVQALEDKGWVPIVTEPNVTEPTRRRLDQGPFDSEHISSSFLVDDSTQSHGDDDNDDYSPSYSNHERRRRNLVKDEDGLLQHALQQRQQDDNDDNDDNDIDDDTFITEETNIMPSTPNPPPVNLNSHPILQAPLLTDDILLVRAFSLSSDITSSSRVDLYEFSGDPAFLLIEERLRPKHRVRMINVTLDRACLNTGQRILLTLFEGIVGMDEIVINHFMYGVKGKYGALRSLRTRETWSWQWMDNDDGVGGSSPHSFISRFLSRIFHNILALWRALLAFAFVSSVTALMVRVLISSGVAIIFPVFSCARYLGYSTDVRLLTLSYPWLGSEVEVLEAMGQNSDPLLRSHLMNVVVAYSMYEACQYAWRRWLYNFKPQPAGLEVSVFSLFMVCEYFLLIYARSALTLRMLPRILALLFITFHLYVFAVPYGYAGLATLCLWSSCTYWMFYFVLECEVKALRRGVVSLVAPRAFYTQLPSPQWPTSLPPLWSVHHQLNRVVRPLNVDAAMDERDDEATSTTITQQQQQQQTPVQQAGVAATTPPAAAMSAAGGFAYRRVTTNSGNVVGTTSINNGGGGGGVGGNVMTVTTSGGSDAGDIVCHAQPPIHDYSTMMSEVIHSRGNKGAGHVLENTNGGGKKEQDKGNNGEARRKKDDKRSSSGGSTTPVPSPITLFDAPPLNPSSNPTTLRSLFETSYVDKSISAGFSLANLFPVPIVTTREEESVTLDIASRDGNINIDQPTGTIKSTPSSRPLYRVLEEVQKEIDVRWPHPEQGFCRRKEYDRGWSEKRSELAQQAKHAIRVAERRGMAAETKSSTLKKKLKLDALKLSES